MRRLHYSPSPWLIVAIAFALWGASSVSLAANIPEPSARLVMLVTGDGVRLRNGPPESIGQVNYDQRRLYRGDRVIADNWAVAVDDAGLGYGIWYRVEAIDHGWSGWVSGRYLHTIRSLPALPTPAKQTFLGKVINWAFLHAGEIDLINNVIGIVKVVGVLLFGALTWMAVRYRKRTAANIVQIPLRPRPSDEEQPATFGTSSNIAWFFPEARRRRAG